LIFLFTENYVLFNPYPKSTSSVHKGFHSQPPKTRLMPSKEKTSETNSKVKEIDEKELAKIERDISVIEREIERIILEQRILARSAKTLKEKEFN